MAIKDILPWNRSSDKVEIMPDRAQRNTEPDIFDRSLNQWMDNFWQDPFNLALGSDSLLSRTGFSPAFDLSESDKEIIVSADIPGMEAKDFNIALESNHLVISGEKKMEKKESGHAYTRVGRMYGSFRQAIPMDITMINAEKINAGYKNGVLTITLPKKEQAAAKSRKIPIKTI